MSSVSLDLVDIGSTTYFRHRNGAPVQGSPAYTVLLALVFLKRLMGCFWSRRAFSLYLAVDVGEKEGDGEIEHHLH